MTDAAALTSNNPLRNGRREPGPYPISCRLISGAVLILTAFGSAVTACSILALRFSLSELIDNTTTSSMGAMKFAILCIPLTGLGLYLIAAPLLYRLVLGNDFIEKHGVFRNTRLSLPEIAGKKTYFPSGSVFIKTVVIYPSNRERLPWKIEMLFNNTEAFDIWIGAVPDLQASPFEWQKYRKYTRNVQYVFLAYMVGFPAIYLLVSHAHRYWHR